MSIGSFMTHGMSGPSLTSIVTTPMLRPPSGRGFLPRKARQYYQRHHQSRCRRKLCSLAGKPPLNTISKSFSSPSGSEGIPQMLVEKTKFKISARVRHTAAGLGVIQRLIGDDRAFVKFIAPTADGDSEDIVLIEDLELVQENQTSTQTFLASEAITPAPLYEGFLTV